MLMCSSKEYHETIVKALYNSFKGSTLANLVAKYKLIGIQGGDVSRKGWWENLVWRPIRQRALGGIAGDKLRSLVVVGGKSVETYRHHTKFQCLPLHFHNRNFILVLLIV